MVSALNNLGLLIVCKLFFTHSGALFLYFKGVLEEGQFSRTSTSGMWSSKTPPPTDPTTHDEPYAAAGQHLEA